MTWDYAEGNPFSEKSGSFSNMISWVVNVLNQIPAQKAGEVSQFDAQSDCGLRNIVVSTEPSLL